MQSGSILLGSGVLALFAAVGPASGAMSSADKQFMIMAARTDMIEAHEGQIAEQQAAKADVKDLGKTLVQDHTDDYMHLTALAAKTGVSIPKGINVAKDRSIEELAHAKGAGFDRLFTRDEIADHKQALAAFKRESMRGKDSDVKAYASSMIPVLEKHLQKAEECAKSVNGSVKRS
jgi:putative membrane protein